MTIGEISERTGLPASTLRYYEKKRLIAVPRDGGGRRDYAESEIEWIRFIRRLKETGMPLRDIRRYAGLRGQGGGTMPERLELLRAHRDYVLEQQRRWAECLQNLEDKIALYQRSIQETGR